MRAHAIHHVPFEGPGRLAEALTPRGFSLGQTWQHLHNPLPSLDNLDLLLVTGGPMSVWEELAHPWLPAEKQLIREALRRGIPTLGICLGAQLIADTLGARVAPMGHREIGWFPVRRRQDAPHSPPVLALPESFPALHWHGDQFELPNGAIPLWESDLCPNQAFLHGSALALQFHLELGPDHLRTLIDHARHDLFPPAPGVRHEQSMLSDYAAFDLSLSLLDRLLDAWLHSLSSSPSPHPS